MKLLYSVIFYLICFTSLAQSPLNVNLTGTGETCGSANGTITLTTTGGTAPFSYLWSNGATTSTLTGVSAGIYSVTVTDQSGATASDNITLMNYPTLQNADLTYIVPGSQWLTTVPCNAMCNGIAYLTESVMIGVPPYYMSLSGTTNPNLQIIMAQGVSAVSNVCVGDAYSVFIYDANGCTANASSPFLFPQASFDFQAQILPACNGLNNGSVTIDFSNLVQSTQMELSYTGPDTGSVIAYEPVTLGNLLPGIYTVTTSYYNSILNCDTTFQITIPDLGAGCGDITGSVYLDTISNCIADAGEPLVPQQMIRFDPGPYFTVSDLSGNFSTSLPFNTYTATLLSQYPLHPVCNVSGLTLTAVNDSLGGVMLGDSVNITTDIHASLAAGIFRPGFPGLLYVNLVNDSYDMIPYPQVNVYYDTLLTYSSSTYTPAVNTPGFLSFYTNALMPFATDAFHIVFQVPADPGLIGDSIRFAATAIANIPEPDTTDNTDSITFVISGSYDPNDKAVYPARDPQNSFYTDVDEEFRYTIRFQNTGTDTAFTVIIVDSLSASLDPSTFRLIATSHPVLVEFSGQDVLSFRFNNILLPDSNTNEIASHGAVSFAIEPYWPVMVPTIENRADIYFDFNPAVLTNVVSSLITVSTSTEELASSNELFIYPNPATEEITISLKNQFANPDKIILLNLLGEQVLEKQITGTGSFRLNVSSLPVGLYLLNVVNDKAERRTGRLIIR